MNSKFYLAAAALTMSLAACTNEADLLSQDNQNEASPITFVLDLNEQEGSRNAWFGNGLSSIMWDKDTHLSLFNGGASGAFGTNNAIYKTNEGESDAKLSFSTQSMVLPGQAIMVHPADTMFSMMSGSLYVNSVVNVPAEGDDILHRMPFISEGIEIGTYDKDSNLGAGYGKEYDVKLRQIGSLLQLRFNWTGYNVIEELLAAGTISQGITIDQVSLNRDEKFNSKLAIALADKGTLGSNWGEVDRYNTWNKISLIDVDVPTEQVEQLTSQDYTYETNIVRFMLLPQNHVVNPVGADGKPVFTANENSSIVIDTYYGTLTLDKNSDKVFPANEKTDDNYYYTGTKKGKPAMTVADGLNYIVAFTNLPKNDPTSTFNGEKVGQVINRDVNADLAKLDMSTVHIENEQHLLDVFYVHKALQPEIPVKFTIDGDTSEEFAMSASTVALLNDWNADPTTGKITLSPCIVAGEACTTIRLTGGGEVPEPLFFEGDKVTVILNDEETAWEWTSQNKNMVNILALVNEGTINIAGNSKLGAANPLNYYGITNKGTLNVNGLVKQTSDVNNFGTINIAVGAEYVADATTLWI